MGPGEAVRAAVDLHQAGVPWWILGVAIGIPLAIVLLLRGRGQAAQQKNMEARQLFEERQGTFARMTSEAADLRRRIREQEIEQRALERDRDRGWNFARGWVDVAYSLHRRLFAYEPNIPPLPELEDIAQKPASLR